MSSSTQKIIEAQQLLAWGNRVAARRHLTLALQENPHDGQLWFWLAQTLDNQAHIINALERALKYDPGLLEAERYLDLLRQVMGKNQFSHTGRTAALIASPISDPPSVRDEITDDRSDDISSDQQPDSNQVDRVTDHSKIAVSVPSSEEEQLLAYKTSKPDHDLSPVTVDDALEASKIRSLEQEPPTGPLRKPAESGLTTRKLALKEVSNEPLTPTHDLALLSDDEELPPTQTDHAYSSDPEANTAPLTKPKKRKRGWFGCLFRLLLLLLLFVGLSLCGWYVISYNLLPQSVIESNPIVATQVTALEESVPPFPTQLALDPNLFRTGTAEPEWLREAYEARYNNQIQDAEKILRTNLVEDPTNIAALLALSDLRRDQLNGEKEALQLAEEALVIINQKGSLDQRGQAAERYVWAMALQEQPDIGLALARGEQAATETPNNPYAQWAYAMASALQNETSIAWEATKQASDLSVNLLPSGLNEAKQAEIYARVGDPEQAIQRYEVALEKTDYIPWRIALVRLLQTQGDLDQAQEHIEYLRKMAPDDPAVKEL